MSIEENILQTQLFVAEINRDIWRNSTCVLNIKTYPKFLRQVLPLPSQVERSYLLSRASRHRGLFAEDPPSFRDLKIRFGFKVCLLESILPSA